MIFVSQLLFWYSVLSSALLGDWKPPNISVNFQGQIFRSVSQEIALIMGVLARVGVRGSHFLCFSCCLHGDCNSGTSNGSGNVNSISGRGAPESPWSSIGCRWDGGNSALRQQRHMWTYRHLHATETPSYHCLFPFFSFPFTLQYFLPFRSVVFPIPFQFLASYSCLLDITRVFSISQLGFDTCSIYKISKLRNRIGIWVG